MNKPQKCQFCSDEEAQNFYPQRKTACKKCINKKRREQNNDPVFKEKKKKADQKYYQKHKDEIIKKRAGYEKANKDKISKYRSSLKRREYWRNYLKEYRRSNLNYRLSECLRARLNRAVSGSYKSGSAMRALGCTIEELKNYLSGLFGEGMSWGNYGEWHIDHIRPLSSFDLSDEKQLKKACHYTNLQPLWAKENIRKSNFIT